MRDFRKFTVAPKMPENLAFLQELANNVWWSWNIDASALFRRMNPALFREVQYNPIALLAKIGQERLEELSIDRSFLSQMNSVKEQFKKEVLTSKNWKDNSKPHPCIAYFSMEFGLHESIHIYSGGLGILAGDHLKSASDLDVPLCGIGILYEEGYFEQHLDGTGYQQENYPKNDVYSLPVRHALDQNGNPVMLTVPLPEGPMHFTVWRLDVGRIPLFLLDTNLPENNPELRHVTGRLYGGDKLNRLRQEVLLGLGGMRALEALGYDVKVSHMNEGHAAFLGIERMATAMREKKLTFDEAREFVRRTSVFTTHTPVPAGNETFKLDLLYSHLKAIEAEGGIPADVTVSMGRAPGDTTSDELSMTILGLNCSRYNNGVAKLHGVVERHMWQHLWPDYPLEEVPIGHVTNGVHVPTWVSSDNSALYDRVLGPDWAMHPLTEKQISKIDLIPDEEIWRIHEAGRAHLIRSTRELLEQTLQRNNAAPEELTNARSVLNKDALTIGFARRFATYKRGNLLLSDRERLKRLLNIPGRPVQFVFAGKAHPADNEGKALIQQIYEFSKDPAVRGKIIFLEDYNMHMARRLVRGVDVWLNTPRRPMEASGTSGMKACINGAIHVSTLDGWWPEGYSKECGWAIGKGEEFSDWRYQDFSDAQALYNLLETEIIPTFYDRPNGELPLKWIAMMKASIKMSIYRFASTRMVTDYCNIAYDGAWASFDALSADNFAVVKQEIQERCRVVAEWGNVSVAFPVADRELGKGSYVGDTFNLTTTVSLGALKPEDVIVEFFYGATESDNVTSGQCVEMILDKKIGNGEYSYKCEVTCKEVGSFGYSARITPKGESWKVLMPGFITWAK